MSLYELQIVHKESGSIVAQWPPQKPEHRGPLVDALVARVCDRLTLEATVEALCERVRLCGVGVGRTEAHVVAGVRAAGDRLRTDVTQQVETAVREAWQDVLHELKQQV